MTTVFAGIHGIAVCRRSVGRPGWVPDRTPGVFPFRQPDMLL